MGLLAVDAATTLTLFLTKILYFPHLNLTLTFEPLFSSYWQLIKHTQFPIVCSRSPFFRKVVKIEHLPLLATILVLNLKVDSLYLREDRGLMHMSFVDQKSYFEIV